jgi:hypothetical protein
MGRREGIPWLADLKTALSGGLKQPRARGDHSRKLSTGKIVEIHTSGVPTAEEVDLLSRFNAEREHGIMHTPEWVAEMEDIQRRYDQR